MKTRVVVMGAGESGVGAAILSKKEGFEVFVSDEHSIAEKYKLEMEANQVSFEENGISEEKLFNATMVVKSPGIPEKNKWVKELRARGIEIISEIELAYRYKGSSKVVAITGSNGKTTTTALLYHICKNAGLSCAMVGNIGYSFARQVATDPKEWYVVEISSFQLDDIRSFRPEIAMITNITEDHLDRYEYKFENYINSKFRITENQRKEDVLIYNDDDEIIKEHLNKNINKAHLLPISMNKKLPEGAYISNAEMHLKWRNEEMNMSVEDFAVKGKHNQYNTMAASLGATVMGIRKEKIRSAVQTFESLEHRMSTVGTIRGVTFINDSKATNVNSTWYALESMTQPVILILGGVDK
ncbi:MAG: UDP-N-acetylmuramoyl-L-alanine--D-glutamate ligase, partial [Ginsengibacter sp.]